MGKDFIHNWPFQNIFSCVAKTVTRSEKLVKECNSIVPHDRSGTANECQFIFNVKAFGLAQTLRGTLTYVVKAC